MSLSVAIVLYLLLVTTAAAKQTTTVQLKQGKSLLLQKPAAAGC
jgi:hypothetical protein